MPTSSTTERSPALDEVARLRADRLDEAAAVLAAALVDDPGYCHLFPDEARREGELRTLYRMTLTDALRHGRVYATTCETDAGAEVTGVVAVYPPGRYPLTLARWGRLLPRLAAVAVRTRTHGRGLARFGDLTSAGVPTDAWYVEALGVRPDRQHAGLGRLLMSRVLAVVDADGERGYLETTRPANLTYYRALGYEPAGEPVPLGPDGPWIHRLARPRGARAEGVAAR
ncbi:GNAT family N-acetyltransferase [Cellulomonas composti]|uniref:N-acetyltransferase domain-containing protein n=1 Tax=Cellulomonas composti TaxID=266130 RepID=A0A511J9W3_9CELL|nr:GNAT family N-acetyltransferase [Cellulomonas composti]GEL94549.1 hypothetical protein CCO02nite_12070 [Cellulomonas composti]